MKRRDGMKPGPAILRRFLGVFNEGVRDRLQRKV